MLRSYQFCANILQFVIFLHTITAQSNESASQTMNLSEYLQDPLYIQYTDEVVLYNVKTQSGLTVFPKGYLGRDHQNVTNLNESDFQSIIASQRSLSTDQNFPCTIFQINRHHKGRARNIGILNEGLIQSRDEIQLRVLDVNVWSSFTSWLDRHSNEGLLKFFFF